MKPWPYFFHSEPPPAQPGVWSWQAMAEMQQELWHRWLDAGRNWLAWWSPGLPDMPWPPAGMVAPRSDEAAASEPTPSSTASPGRPVRARRAPAPAAKGPGGGGARKSAVRPAGKGLRHH